MSHRRPALRMLHDAWVSPTRRRPARTPCASSDTSSAVCLQISRTCAGDVDSPRFTLCDGTQEPQLDDGRAITTTSHPDSFASQSAKASGTDTRRSRQIELKVVLIGKSLSLGKQGTFLPPVQTPWAVCASVLKKIMFNREVVGVFALVSEIKCQTRKTI